MIQRFCLYSIFKNLRFFETFFVLFLLAGSAFDGPELSYFQIGVLIGYQKLLTGLLEIPLGAATDRWGRRRALIGCFGSYVLAFPLYASASGVGAEGQMVLLYAAQTLFGVGEALRTGSHKAIMLDWLDQQGQHDRATHVLSVTRLCSKLAAGVSALLGGVMVYATGSFAWLFWAATLPAALGVVLMFTYPRNLEGEQVRCAEHNGKAQQNSWRQRLIALAGSPGMILLIVQSIVFESQIKLAQLYLQPYLKSGIEAKHIAIAGGFGAVLVGVYYLIHDTCGGLASLASIGVERKLRGGRRSLNHLYVLATIVMGAIAASLLIGQLWAGVAAFIVLAALQNMRRPIYVAQLNRVMDKPQRATTLSIDNQVRGGVYAVLAPLTGKLADSHGLAAALLVLTGILLLGMLLLPAMKSPTT